MESPRRLVFVIVKNRRGGFARKPEGVKVGYGWFTRGRGNLVFVPVAETIHGGVVEYQLKSR